MLTACEGRYLLTAKTGHPAVVTDRGQPCPLRGQPRTARGEELTHLAPVSTGIACHAFDGRPIPNRLGVTTVIPHAVTPSYPCGNAREPRGMCARDPSLGAIHVHSHYRPEGLLHG
jgi:hypothetical protein